MPQLIFRTIPLSLKIYVNLGYGVMLFAKWHHATSKRNQRGFLSVFVVPKMRSNKTHKLVKWPDASPYEYFLWGEQARFNVRMLKGNRLLFMLIGGPEPAAYETAGTVYSVWEKVQSTEMKR